MTVAVRWARERLGYHFADEGLLELALTHRSASSRNNERLEFLGDAVLGLVVAAAVFERRPAAGEGLLSRIRSRLVRGETLAELARELGLGELVRLGGGEARSGGHQRTSVLANALEAVLGAIYLDGGMAAAEAVVLKLYAGRLADLPDEEALTDPKTRLQEWLQARGWKPPAYTVRKISGAPHAQLFEVACEVAGLDLLAEGHGRSRRMAEQDAAQQVLGAILAGHGSGSEA